VRVSSQWLLWDTIVQIPSTAIWVSESGQQYIYKVLPNNKLKLWNIQVSDQQWDITYVNQWLKSTDMIVANIQIGNRDDGMVVEVTK
jgi:outer membrane biogenesis lipoprotein LolB